MSILDCSTLTFVASNIRAAFAKQLGKDDGLSELLQFIAEDEEWDDRRHVAYVIATASHETAFTFRPITERGPRSYFNRYEPNTQIGKRLGNTRTGDGWKYRGHGYVQLTGRNNFKLFSNKLGIDLIGSPELALDPRHSYNIMATGMREGLFTGKKLADYISAANVDYRNARRIINGIDRAADIAAYARAIEFLITPKEMLS